MDIDPIMKENEYSCEYKVYNYIQYLLDSHDLIQGVEPQQKSKLLKRIKPCFDLVKFSLSYQVHFHLFQSGIEKNDKIRCLKLSVICVCYKNALH